MFRIILSLLRQGPLESGMDIKTLSELMGHKNPMVTLRRYAHSMLEHKTEMMNRLGKFCGLKSL